jgi:hypothetical protein
MNPLTVTLSASVVAEVKRIGEILGLSPDQCAEYLIERCLDLYKDTGGDTSAWPKSFNTRPLTKLEPSPNASKSKRLRIT